jgi:ABC-type Fe3+ transport system substrate-binding protein
MNKRRLSYLLLSFVLLHFIGLAPSYAQTTAAKERWDKALAAARKEGSVVVFGPGGQYIRDAITQGFKKAYPDIGLEYFGGRELDHGLKITAERNGGIFNADVAVSGVSLAHAHLIPNKAVEPLEQALMLPEVTDLSKWRDNKIEYSDSQRRFNIAFLGQVSPVLIYDPRAVKPEEVDEYNKLLDPKWKGRIIINDPTPPGPGHAFFRWLWRVIGPEKAGDYIRRLRAQAGTVDRDFRRQVEWVAHGRYAISLSPGDQQVQGALNAGIKIGVVGEFHDIGSWLTSSAGNVSLMNRAPHPNAAAVFINWLLTRETQTAYSRALNTVSRRLDVPTDHVPDYVVPKAGKKYWRSYTDDVTRRTDEEEKLIKELFGR